ncbi:MAG: hypothetical protein JXB38_18105 [Anaerolineales bacterium]|nr:hypothetical protein [Anaerolineales bacterium]
MDKLQVLASCKQWFNDQDYDLDEEVEVSVGWRVDISAIRGEARWLVTAIGDNLDEWQYLYDFDGAIDRLIGTNTQLEQDVFMAVALPFSSTENGLDLSYRRALKKYSNSIIFLDLNISLLLVREDASLQVLTPEAVNPFLRDLNRLIGRRGQQS